METPLASPDSAPSRQPAAVDQNPIGGRWRWLIPLTLLVAAGVYHVFSMRVGWDQPLTDAQAFRQTQTAISTYWLIGHPFDLLSYETPVLGPPWPIPFEFPIYQSCVAALVTMFHTPLDQTARFVSLFFFWMMLVALYFLLGRFDVSKALRVVVISLVLLNPFYLFWSRCVLIESTALFFSMAFLSAAASYTASPRRWMLIACIAWGVLAGLTKITTFVPFAGGVVLVVLRDLAARRPGLSEWLRRSAATAAMVAVPLAAVAAWTHHADAVKAQNPLGAHLTSQALTSWNFGSSLERCNLKYWYLVVWQPLCEMQYHVLVIFGCLVGVVLARRRVAVIAGCLSLYFIAPLIFARIYGHPYYAMANLIFFLMFMGLSIIGLLECGGWRRMIGVGLFAAALIAALWQHQTLYLPFQEYANHWAVQIAETVRRTTNPDDVIVIYGCDWSPEIPYYAQRRALMLPTFVDQQTADAAFHELDNLSVGAMVIASRDSGPGWHPHTLEDYVEQRQRWKLSSVPCFQDATCTIYPPVRYEPAYRDYWPAMGSLKQGKLDVALEEFNRAIAEFPGDPAFYIGRAFCHMLRKNAPAMRADCRRAVELAPTDFMWSQQAVMLLNASRQLEGHPTEARQLLDDALDSINQSILMQRRDPLGYRLRSQILSALGRENEASDDARRAKELSIPPERSIAPSGRVVINQTETDAGQ